MTFVLGLLFALLLVAAAAVYRQRLAVLRSDRGLTDEQIRRIEEHGVVEFDDEPLDLDAIQAEEERFWEETWDEPDEA